jgi:hypothetical protein
MNPDTITWTLIISCMVILIIWDIIDKIIDPSGNSTISWQTWLAATRRPIIAVGAGILVGHLFGQNLQLSFIIFPKVCIVIVLVINILLLLYCETFISYKLYNINLWLEVCRRPIIGLLLGIVIGVLFWQTPS